MRRMLPTVLMVALAAIPFAAASCGGRGGGPPSGPQTVAATGGGASSVIGAQGGTVSLPNGTSVSVPAGALAVDQTITITPSSSSPSSGGVTAVGPAYELGPDGLTFSRPVTVTLAYDPALIPAGRSRADVKVFMAPHGSTDFASLPTIAVDSTHVAAPSMHFTAAGPGVPGAPPAAGSAAPAPASKPLPVPRILTPKAGHGDVVCLPSPEPNRWFTAEQCLPKCLGSAINPHHCFVKPTCPGILSKISSADNNSFSSLYQMAAGNLAFTAGVGVGLAPSSLMFLPPPSQTQAGAAAWILRTFFNQGPPDLKIDVAEDPNPADWAHLGPPPGKVGTDADKKKLLVEGLGFKSQSPGAEVSTLGHEMIHYLQHQRVNYTYIGNIMDIVDALREVEAYSWETGQTAIDVIADTSAASSFSWSGHDQSTLNCGDRYEREAAQASASCYEWKVHHLLAHMVATIGACGAGGDACDSANAQLVNVKEWLGAPPHGDIWAGPVWATLHPNWDRFQDEPAPLYTIHKDDGDTMKVDCSTY